MKIVKASKLKKTINKYAKQQKVNKNQFVHVYFVAIYEARIFGFCVIRDTKLWNELTRNSKNCRRKN